VQIGDPYTQKKMHDFLLEARDEGLIRFITDNGGGGLSSSVGESALFSNGCEIQLEKVPLKYDGLDQWEIWISESQERMTVAIDPGTPGAFHGAFPAACGREHRHRHLHRQRQAPHHLQRRHLCLCRSGPAQSAFPQWEFEAVWQPPALRGLTEPVLGCPTILPADLDMLAAQHLFQGVGLPPVRPRGAGHQRDQTPGRCRSGCPSDAAVIRPVLTSEQRDWFSLRR
jgi:hypothetical protein